MTALSLPIIYGRTTAPPLPIRHAMSCNEQMGVKMAILW
jgi:hypothetical protein